MVVDSLNLQRRGITAINIEAIGDQINRLSPTEADRLADYLADHKLEPIEDSRKTKIVPKDEVIRQIKDRQPQTPRVYRDKIPDQTAIKPLNQRKAIMKAEYIAIVIAVLAIVLAGVAIYMAW